MKYFKFYVNDFLIGTSFMTATEVGIYIRMLCYQFDKGSIPNDMEIIRGMFGAEITPLVLEKFSTTEAGLINLRLDAERKAAVDKIEKLTSNGKKGAKNRWAGDTFKPDHIKPAPENINFYIGIEAFELKPSEYMTEYALKYVETQLMKHSLGERAKVVLNETLTLLDSDYIQYTFTNSNHIKNSFKSCLDKILNKNTNSKPAKLPIHGSSSFQ